MKWNTPSRAAGTLTLGLVLLVATTIFAQQLSAPTASDQTTARLVTEMIGRFHISQHGVNDDVSAQLLDKFVEELDPLKLYFLKSDIDRFSRYRNHLDDLLVAGDIKFAHEVYDLYVKRLDSQIALAHTLIDSDFDFTVDERMETDRKMLKWSADEEELQDRWRKRVKYETLTLKLDDVELPEIRKRLHKRYDTIARNAHEIEPGEIMETYLSQLAATFDPHSSYMSPQTLEDFQISMRLSLEGIGAALRSEDGYTTVAQVVPGGAADKDGRLKVNDKIIAVGQEEGEFVDIVEMKLKRVVRLIRGSQGTKVRLRVLTEAGETKEYTLVRQRIELKSSEVKGEILNTKDRISGTDMKIGVINIPSFYRDFGGAQQGLDDFKSTARDVMTALAKFDADGGVDAIIIDLRMNGGGALSEAIEVSGLFIDKGPVVQVKEPDGRVRTHDDVEAGLASDKPLIVVCNRLSASASEIFAAAIKDYRRGIVVGDQTTHGKGTVQNVMPVSNRLFQLLNPTNRGALKLTINQFYRVNGDSTQNHGVHSDVVLPSLLDHMDLGESFLDNALAFDRIAAAPHDDYGMVSPAIISDLQRQSSARIAGNEDFTKVQQDIEEYLRRKNRPFVPLNEAKLLEERKLANAEEKLAEDEAEKDLEDGPVLAEGSYNDEILNIAIDYVKLLNSQRTAQK